MTLFKTSKEAKEILDNLRIRTHIRPNLWARAALCYALSFEASLPETQYDSEGKEFPESVFFGEDEQVLMALLRQRLNRDISSEEIGKIVKNYVEHGLRLLNIEFDRFNRRGDEFMLFLHKSCQDEISSAVEYTVSLNLLPDKQIVDNYKIELYLGDNVKDKQPVNHTLNSPGLAPHIAIMGRNSTGKTRIGLALLKRLTQEAKYSVPFLIFDYAKGDIASDSEFVSATKAKVIRFPEDQIPLAPLAIPLHDENSIQLAAHRFRDTICSVVHLGAVQKELCLSLIKELYTSFGNDTPNLEDLVELMDQESESKNWKAPSLKACIHEFSSFPLFQPAQNGIDHDFYKTSHIIDVHNLPEDLRKLTVFLTLDRLFSEIMRFPEAPLDKDGNRQLRLIIVIDEAHNYLPCRQKTLEKMVREARSKGIGIWLISQSPDDFDQASYNFAHEMGLSIVFSCVLEKPKMLEAVLGGKVDPKRLSQLPRGTALTRISDSAAPIEIQAWRP